MTASVYPVATVPHCAMKTIMRQRERILTAVLTARTRATKVLYGAKGLSRTPAWGILPIISASRLRRGIVSEPTINKLRDATIRHASRTVRIPVSPVLFGVKQTIGTGSASRLRSDSKLAMTMHRRPPGGNPAVDPTVRILADKDSYGERLSPVIMSA